MSEVQSGLLVWLAVLSLAVVFAVCLIGVRSRVFKDSLSQRLGLGVVAFGTVAEVSHILMQDIADPYRAVLYGGLALYACATVLKWYRMWTRHGRPQHAFRRSTDFVPDESQPHPQAYTAAEELRRVA
jgi:hypothetical protein